MRCFAFMTDRYEEDSRDRRSAERKYKIFKKRVEGEEGEKYLKQDLKQYKFDFGNYIKLEHGRGGRTIIYYEDRVIAGQLVCIAVAVRDFRHDSQYDEFYRTT